jgi:hypothetical protein
VAHGALCGRVLTFVDIAADETSEFLFHVWYPFSVVWNFSNYKDTNNPHHLQQPVKRCIFEKKTSFMCNIPAKRKYIFAA